MQKKTYLILFPGARGNRTEEIVCWWFQWVIRFFVSYFGKDNLEVVPLTYVGGTLVEFAEMTDRKLQQIQIPPNTKVIAVGYSMGGQIMRLVAGLRQIRGDRDFDHKVIFFSSGPRGMRQIGFLRGYRAIAKAFTLGAIIGMVTLTEVEEVYRMFFNTSPRDAAFDELCRRVLEYSHSEFFWACVQLAVWPFRVKAPPLRGQVHMVVAKDDIFFKDELDGRSSDDENWKIVGVNDGHGAILDENAVFGALNSIRFD